MNGVLIKDLIVPTDITVIEPYAFCGCDSLISVTIPDNVNVIGYSSFESCNNLKTIDISSNVSSIGRDAFKYCYGISDVYCRPMNCPALYYDEYYGDWGLHFYSNCSIYVPNLSIGLYRTTDGWSEYVNRLVAYDFEKGEIVPDTTATPANNEIWYTTTDGNIVNTSSSKFNVNIESNIYKDGKGIITFDGDVKQIGYLAFFWTKNLCTIHLPDSIESIEAAAFYGCPNLSAFYGILATEDNRCLIINTSTGNELVAFAPNGIIEYSFPDVVTIADSILQECTTIEKIILPNGLKSIGESAFNGCTNLRNINMPDSVSSIGSWAFSGSAIESMNIPNNVEIIGDHTFRYCSNLSYIHLPNELQRIGDYAFSECINLIKVNNMSSSKLYRIGAYAFCGCQIDSIDIPANVTSIGYYAFLNCESLKTVWSKNITPPTAIFSGNNIWDAFAGCHADLAIFVPSKSYDAFITAPGWSDYKSSIVDGGDYFDDEFGDMEI
ncbi:MAG: leucine-rich repeat domain-containing protein [Alistipes sp.]|nr:leucine-rich repeat domain-containing protein [Alistipes sp.]